MIVFILYHLLIETLQRLVLLDSDMLVIRNMDELFDMDLPFDFIAANHACVCNYAKDPWADADW